MPVAKWPALFFFTVPAASADTAENDCYCNGVGCESQPTAAAAAAEMDGIRAEFAL